jgi:flagellar L-ring protein precursor FlgH
VPCRPAALLALPLVAACGGTALPGAPPPLSAASFPVPLVEAALRAPPAPALESVLIPSPPPVAGASLWSGSRDSLLGDDRAKRRGDILTVVVAIDESAEITASSDSGRTASQGLAIDALFGLPEAVAGGLPGGAGLSPAVAIDSGASFAGDGTTSREGSLELRVAATVTEVLPNGVLAIAGSQEVRVNNELRELLVSGFVRPSDISRGNEVSSDRIAQARISYGGRGVVAAAQAPRIGTQILDTALPF